MNIIKKLLGFIPKGIENALHVKALAPDYTIEGMNDILAYYLSGMLGVALIFGIFYLAWKKTCAIESFLGFYLLGLAIILC